MSYQEQFQFDFKKLIGSSSGRTYCLCISNGQTLSGRMLASMLSVLDIDNLRFLLSDIDLYLSDQNGDFFHSFDGMDETIEFQENQVLIGEFQYEISDLKGILSEWIEFFNK